MTALERFNKKAESPVSEGSEETEPFTVLFVMNETSGKAEIRVVETGIQSDKYIQIKKGILEGDKVITGPYELVSHKLKPGDKVIKKSDKKEEETATKE
jgi:HlyD family secretion protein